MEPDTHNNRTQRASFLVPHIGSISLPTNTIDIVMNSILNRFESIKCAVMICVLFCVCFNEYFDRFDSTYGENVDVRDRDGKVVQKEFLC